MSLSGSLADGGAKTGDESITYGGGPEGPGASAENPGGVYPLSDPSPAGPAHQNTQTQPMGHQPQIGHVDAVPQATNAGIPGTGKPADAGTDPRLIFSNPAMFGEVMVKLSTALTEAMHAIDDELGSGIGGTGRALRSKLEGWRAEVDGMRQGKSMGVDESEGGIDRKGPGGLGGGGLYDD